MFLKITCSLAMLSALSVSANATDRNFIATSMSLACPHATHIRVDGAGYTARVEQRYQKKTEKCLSAAYIQALTNPFPVNMTGIAVATRVRVANGKIILY